MTAITSSATQIFNPRNVFIFGMGLCSTYVLFVIWYIERPPHRFG